MDGIETVQSNLNAIPRDDRVLQEHPATGDFLHLLYSVGDMLQSHLTLLRMALMPWIMLISTSAM